MSSEFPQNSLNALVEFSKVTKISKDKFRCKPYTKFTRSLATVEEIQVNSQENNSNINKMPLSNTDINNLCNTLPEFKPEDNLSTFIKSVDNLILFFNQQTVDATQIYIINTHIISKVKNEARDFLNLHNKTTWDEVKPLLLQKYGDRRTEEILLTQLNTTVQKRSESYDDYYNRITVALNDLLQHVSLHENNAQAVEFKASFFRKQALRTFCTGINNPYCDHLSHFELNSLDEALQKCIALDNHKQQQQYMSYLKSTTYPRDYQKPQSSRPPPNNNQRNSQPQNQNQNRTYNPRPQPPNNVFDFNKPGPRQTFPTNRQVFGPSSRPNPPQNQFKPTPMSGIQTQRTNFSQNKPSPMSTSTYNNRSYNYNVECESTYQENPEYSENFREIASESPTNQQNPTLSN